MRIREIHIYGYGKLERVSLTNLGDLTVFYGENEAGKSTLMSFIHSVLFGFPTRQTPELRYEPKTGATYGGKLVAQTKANELVTIERVAGKSAGQVTVTFANGVVGGEAELQDLLQQMDKSLFQSIFSFNLQGLQNIHQLKNEELGRFLFSTGSVGTDRLVAVENKLQKELDERFKPSGKKPILNEKLKQLKVLAADLKKAEATNESYWQMQQDHEEALIELADLAREEQRTAEHVLKLTEWKRMEPIWKESVHTQKELEPLGDIMFPIDGIRRLEALEARLLPLKAEQQQCTKKLERLGEELADNEANPLVLSKKPEILETIESMPLLESVREEALRLEHELREVQQTISLHQEKLHLALSPTELTEIDTSIFMKERVHQVTKKQAKLVEKKDQLDERYEREKAAIQLLEEKETKLQAELLPPHRRGELEELAHSSHDAAGESELAFLTNQRMMLVTAQNEAEQRKKQAKFQSTLFMMIGLVMLGWGIVQALFLQTIIAVVLVGLSLYMSRTSRGKGDTWKKELADVETKLAKRQARRESQPVDVTYVREQLKRDKQVEEELRLTKIKWEQQNQQYEQILTEYEIWEQEKMANDAEMGDIGRLLHLPKSIAMSFLLDAFHLLEALKEETRKQDLLQQEWEKRRANHQRLADRLRALGKLFFDPLPSSVQVVHGLRDIVQREVEKEIRRVELQKQKIELEEQLEKLNRQVRSLIEERQALLDLAGVDTDEAYRARAELADKRSRLEQLSEELDKQLSFSSLTKAEQEYFQTVVQLDAEIALTQERQQELLAQKETCQQHLSDLKHRIKEIEDGGTYSSLLHRFTMAKAELEYEAKDWARYALAKEVLRRTVQVFNEERLPAVLEQSEKFLAALTDGRYVKMLPHENGSGFLIHRNDSVVFEANELSQATMEQVYVSLRLALICTIYQNHPMPIIIDDSFVNFDAKRTSKVIDLLTKWSHNQVLFFTCHVHLLNSFDEGSIVPLGHNPVLT